jgi:3-methylcrotonyl-CoA carboxylase alpha subunit
LFSSLLIANRGEIACRVIRTAKRMGLRTIAVYSTEDRDARHVALADEAREIGPASARESYLDIARVLGAARSSDAAAIHPGYGFLSENADFAAACAATGIVFVGPPESAIRALGDKAQAKALMQQAGVPVVPGYHGDDQSEARFFAEAGRLSYPVLVKAAAGGGGRGMRIANAERDLAAAVASARREAEASFGDGRLILEKHLVDPRHVEVQIFADRSGAVIHLFDRDCSIQRRHQKLVEEAPAPGLDAGLRRALQSHAVTAARAAAYVGAGTIEFLVAGDACHFIEMNTRLQVEHPVTEMITGLDLVEWQLRVAAGEHLPLTQDGIVARGHAIEARLYAEDPAHDFLPQSGTVSVLRFPAETAHVRVETGMREGDEVGVHYDALVAKLIAWGTGREEARRTLAAALASTRIAGVLCNREFLLRTVRHESFANGAVDTGFIARHRTDLVPDQPLPFEVLAAAGLVLFDEITDSAARDAARGPDPYSPWQARDGWRLCGREPLQFRLEEAGSEHLVSVCPQASGGCVVASQGRSAVARLSRGDPAAFAITLDGVRFSATVLRRDAALTVVLSDAIYRLDLIDPLSSGDREQGGAEGLTAPMPGKVLAVHVAPGDHVVRGQLLMVLEAMKMEHAIAAPAEGVVEAVYFAAGDVVAEGTKLLAVIGS